MVIMQTPNGSAKYRLRATTTGLRLVSVCASLDLLTMMQAGWRIVDATVRARQRLGPTLCATLVVRPTNAVLSDHASTAA